MGRRKLSPKRREQALAVLLPHRELVTIEPYLGGGANGRSYGQSAVLARAQIVDKVAIVRDQYDKEVTSPSAVFFETSALPALPAVESRVQVWAGTDHARDTHIITVARYEHPDIADLVEVRLA